jgi:bacterioferritin (cytochrome b1)
MKYLISALEKMVKEEKEGAKKYNQLAKFLYGIGLIELGEVAKNMSSDEYEHSKNLGVFIRVIEKEFGSKLKGR